MMVFGYGENEDTPKPMRFSTRIFTQPVLGAYMKFIQSLVAIAVCATSFSVFAAAHTAAPAAAPGAAPAAAAPAVKMTRAERSAAKKQIEADDKMAKAACKKLNGAEKSTCKKEASAKEKSAKAALKAKP